MISLKAFIAKTKGTIVKFHDSNGQAGQCVTLIQEYIRQCYNVPFKARGHAKDWISTCGDIADKTNTPQYGDVIVWGDKATNSGLGHIAIYIDSNQYYDQYTGKKAGYSSISVNKAIKPAGYLRLKGIRIPDEENPKYNLTRLLRNGSKGNDVKELQKALGGLVVDGIFGAKTLAKVKAYQKSKKLYQDGIVGKNTAHALGWLYLNK